jgi:hypothetical protein
VFVLEARLKELEELYSKCYVFLAIVLSNWVDNDTMSHCEYYTLCFVFPRESASVVIKILYRNWFEYFKSLRFFTLTLNVRSFLKHVTLSWWSKEQVPKVSA